MTDHLPECPEINEKPDWYCCEDCDPGPWDDCICDWLRACEQRVREEWYEVQSETWEQGYKYALDAARGAVARLQHKPGASIANAVSAIDALSENPDDQPVSENPNDAR